MPERHGTCILVRHAHGVVSIIAPWNYPIEEVLNLALPALIAGNAAIIKPSEVTPLSSGATVECLTRGLELHAPGLLHLVQGDGALGAYLVSHPGVDMCAFTGSSACLLYTSPSPRDS